MNIEINVAADRKLFIVAIAALKDRIEDTERRGARMSDPGLRRAMFDQAKALRRDMAALNDAIDVATEAAVR